MSLISFNMFYNLDAKLKEIFYQKKKTAFGGIGVMICRDLLQIPPVTAGYIFTVPRNPIFKVAYDLENLWGLFEPWILKHNHRQGEGCKWANIFNKFSEEIVDEADSELLRGKKSDESHLDFDAMHLGYANLEIQNHNDNVLSKTAVKLEEIEA